MGLSPTLIETAYLTACQAELEALKPGNVHRFAGGHGMDVAVFERSAAVSAPFIAAPGRPVGWRIREAMRATWAEAGMNTNLGILLLCGPLAIAAERAEPVTIVGSGIESLGTALAETLDGLVLQDAADVFSAIAMASPGGLGRRSEHDVREAPRISLLDAMRIAAPTDEIAAQYADRFAGVLNIGVPEIRRARARGRQGMWPVVDVFFAFASGFPDSHVARKFGPDAAESLRLRMAFVSNQLSRLGDEADKQAMLLDFDAELKGEGLNPGTSADLTVASIFSDVLATKLEEVRRG